MTPQNVNPLMTQEHPAQEKKKILEVEQLANNYEGQPLLQNISFSLKEGEILCLLGPSGSGKTTLLRLLAGLEREDAGTISFAGKNIQNIPPHKRNFGMMFQEYALFPHKSVWNNIAFGLEMQQCPKEEADRRIETMLEMVGLSGLENRKIDELSGGERQRVALARSLAPEPQLLLLDEPLGSLDRALRDRLTGEIRAILKSLSVTAVFVTHDQAEAFSIADKVAILHNGHLQQFDSPEDLYRRPANRTVARFLGFSNLVEGYFDDNSVFHSPLGPLKIFGEIKEQDSKSNRNLKKRKYNAGTTTLLLRPEGARIVNSSESIDNSGDKIILSGIISARQFQGGTYKLAIKVGDSPLCFDLPLDPSPPATGQQVELSLNPSSIVCIES